MLPCNEIFSFDGRFVTVDAHFACMDGVCLDFLLRFLEHWLVHNSGVSLISPIGATRSVKKKSAQKDFGYSACNFGTLAGTWEIYILWTASVGIWLKHTKALISTKSIFSISQIVPYCQLRHPYAYSLLLNSVKEGITRHPPRPM